MAESSVEVARIMADATIQSANIAAHASQINTLITAAGTIVSLIGAVLAGYVAYRNAQAPLKQAELNKNRLSDGLLAELDASLEPTIFEIKQIIDLYEGNFKSPVELRVLPLPPLIDPSRYQELSNLNADIREAAAVVTMRLNDYRRAKQPIQDRFRPDGDNRTVNLTKIPDGFSQVIETAKAYKSALNRLKTTVTQARQTLKKS